MLDDPVCSDWQHHLLSSPRLDPDTLRRLLTDRLPDRPDPDWVYGLLANPGLDRGACEHLLERIPPGDDQLALSATVAVDLPYMDVDLWAQLWRVVSHKRHDTRYLSGLLRRAVTGDTELSRHLWEVSRNLAMRLDSRKLDLFLKVARHAAQPADLPRLLRRVCDSDLRPEDLSPTHPDWARRTPPALVAVCARQLLARHAEAAATRHPIPPEAAARDQSPSSLWKPPASPGASIIRRHPPLPAVSFPAAETTSEIVTSSGAVSRSRRNIRYGSGRSPNAS